MRTGLLDAIDLGAAYLASWVSMHVDGAPRPFSASFSVTNRCNIHCSYCNCPALDPSELGLEPIGRLFSRLRALGVRRLGLLGGEPLIRPDFSSIVELAKKQGFYVTINTNLTLFERRPEALDRVDFVFTSLDGDAGAHAKNRGERSLDGVLEAVRELRRRGKPVVAMCVMTEHNRDQAPFLLDLAERLEIRVFFQPQCVGTSMVRGGLPPALTDQACRDFWLRLIEEKRKGRPIACSMSYLRALSRWEDFRVSAYMDEGLRCAAGRAFLYVDPLGRGYPCTYTKGKVEPVDLLRDDWKRGFEKKTPCSTCLIGPLLEYNLLMREPAATLGDAVRNYLI